MTTIQRIAKNTVVLLVANIVSKVLSFFYIMYTARYLGAEGFGILSFALAFTGIFSVFTNLGLGQLTIREVARDKSLAPKYLANISTMKIFLVSVTFGLIAIVINLLGYPDQTIKVVYLITLSIIFSAFNGMFYSIFQAFEKMEYQSLGQILNSVLMLCGVLFAIKYGFSVIGFASLYFMVNIIILGYSFTILRWRFSNPNLNWSSQKIEIDWSFWKSTIKEALPFGLTGIFIMIYYWIDSVMLSLIKGNLEVGWYNVAYRLNLIPLIIPGIFNSVMFPVMAKYFISSKVHLNQIYQRYFKYMVIFSIPIGVGISFLSERIILLIFGEEYIPSIIALQILIWSSVFIFMGAAFGRLIESLNKQIIGTKIAGSCAILNIILNLLLIPRYSFIGASVATVITGFTVLVVLYISSIKLGYKIPTKDIIDNVGKAIIASM